MVRAFAQWKVANLVAVPLNQGKGLHDLENY